MILNYFTFTFLLLFYSWVKYYILGALAIHFSEKNKKYIRSDWSGVPLSISCLSLTNFLNFRPTLADLKELCKMIRFGKLSRFHDLDNIDTFAVFHFHNSKWKFLLLHPALCISSTFNHPPPFPVILIISRNMSQWPEVNSTRNGVTEIKISSKCNSCIIHWSDGPGNLQVQLIQLNAGSGKDTAESAVRITN